MIKLTLHLSTTVNAWYDTQQNERGIRWWIYVLTSLPSTVRESAVTQYVPFVHRDSALDDVVDLPLDLDHSPAEPVVFVENTVDDGRKRQGGDRSIDHTQQGVHDKKNKSKKENYTSKRGLLYILSLGYTRRYNNSTHVWFHYCREDTIDWLIEWL